MAAVTKESSNTESTSVDVVLASNKNEVKYNMSGSGPGSRYKSLSDRSMIVISVSAYASH